MPGYKLRRCVVCKKYNASYLVPDGYGKGYYCHSCWEASQAAQPKTGANLAGESPSEQEERAARLPVTQKDIVAGLLELGVTPICGVMVHSSLKSFGVVEGGAGTFIAALMEVITPAGTLMMPTFNHGAPFEEGGAGYFNPRETPTRNGAVPDFFWRMPGVERSLDPTHAVAAWGVHSRRYTEFHHRTTTMGAQSPLGLLCADDGYGLMLGVGYGTNTFHHVVEMTTGAPCLGLRTEAYPVVLPDGRKVMGRTWGWRDGVCPLTDEVRYRDDMEVRGLQKVVLIGSSRATLFRLRDCYDVIAEILRSGKEGFPPCSGCQIRTRHVAQTVASDWDAKNGVLKPDSEAWNY